jgi:hypothetical protein
VKGIKKGVERKRAKGVKQEMKEKGDAKGSRPASRRRRRQP